MKKYFFFPVFTLFLSLMLLVGCDRSDQPVPEEVPGTVGQIPDNKYDPEAPLVFRDDCDQVEGQCLVSLTVTPGTAGYYLCGTLIVGTADCYQNTTCGEVGGDDGNFTGNTEFCITEGRRFFVQNTGLANITVTASSSGGSSAPITVASGARAVFELDNNCDVDWLCTD